MLFNFIEIWLQDIEFYYMERKIGVIANLIPKCGKTG